MDYSQLITLSNPPSTMREASLTTFSTIDSTLRLYHYVGYPTSGASLPLVVFMPGFEGAAVDYTAELRSAFASYGCVCLFPDTRGRGLTATSKDVSAREIYDIYDCIQNTLNVFGDMIDAEQIYIYGYSGGGGNVLGALSKFPDTFNAGFDWYGISDYGEDATYGWYFQNTGYDAVMNSYIGGSPATYPNRYKARNAQAAITNYTGGKLWIFHDAQDGIVQVDQSSRIKAALDAAGMTNYSYNVTDTGDSPRWEHAGDTRPLANAMIFSPIAAKTQVAWTIEAAATKTVIGYMKTKRFEIRLNANGTATFGIDAAATVTYNTATDTYTVTPLTGAIDVAITQGAKTGSATNISTATEIVVT